MNQPFPLYRMATLAALFTASVGLQAAADTPREDRPREDKNYAGLLFTKLDHRSIGDREKEQAWSNAGQLVYGGHITNLFHAEVRAGGGFSDAIIDGELALTIDYFASWYMGLHYPITDYANVYGQAGFSYIHGDAALTPAGMARKNAANETSPFEDFEGDYPGSTFSLSWIVGADMEVASNTYLVVEGGRLFKDTGTGANTFQISTGLRYEF